ncbi:MAG: hypothetical protein LBC46_00370 [Treponema sp.]|nr:hypothetical protein [Treponema sp.]
MPGTIHDTQTGIVPDALEEKERFRWLGIQERGRYQRNERFIGRLGIRLKNRNAVLELRSFTQVAQNSLNGNAVESWL